LYGSLPVDAARLFIAPQWLQQVEADVIPPRCEAPGVREPQYQIYAGGGDDGIFLKGTLARFGVDERDASSDRRLIDFALRLPAEQYLNNGVTRRLAREGLSDRLPPAILRHKVRGYQGADWFAKFRADQALAWIEEISASPSASELLDLKQMRADIERLLAIAALDPGRLRQWGHRFTRALAVGAFLRECEQDFELIGRR
jgi:asparagine synthase (glutamine-hydrolysing)